MKTIDGHALKMGAPTALGRLTGLLGDVEVGQTDEGAEGKEPRQQPHRQLQGKAIGGGHGHAHGRGQHAEADHVAKGVDLDAEALFLVGALFAGAGDLAVEHVADAGGQKTAECIEGMALGGQVDACAGNEQTDVREDNRVIVETDHESSFEADEPFLGGGHISVHIYYTTFFSSAQDVFEKNSTKNARFSETCAKSLDKSTETVYNSPVLAHATAWRADFSILE